MGVMVVISDGNSEMGAHVLSELGNLTWYGIGLDRQRRKFFCYFQKRPSHISTML